MLTPSQRSRATTLLAFQSPMIRMLPSSSPDPIPPKGKAGLAMSFAMAMHFFGYEFARGSNMALFTSSTLGFGNASGSYYPLAMACVSPMSMILLLGYGRQLSRDGPRKALRNTTLLCILALALSGVVMAAMQLDSAAWSQKALLPWSSWESFPLLGKWSVSQLVVWLSFVFQNSYAHLLYAQQWSFLGSIFTPTQAGKYYSYVAGLSSICSMIAGASLSKLVGFFGLPGLLLIAATSLTITMVLADWSYSLAEKHGFDPSIELQKQKKTKNKSESTEDTKSSSAKSHPISPIHQIREAINLFRRVPTLGALFCETLTFQSLSTILNTCLVTQLKQAVPNDAERAAWTGNFYACVNGLSTFFQFLVLPILNQHVEPKFLWRIIPLLPLCCGIVQCLPTHLLPEFLSSFSSTSALYLVAISFLTAKTLDYSLRNVLAELVYVPLDFESRYVGKEIIAVFANRFGKSGMAVILSLFQFLRGGSGGGLAGMALFASFGWWASAFSLSSLVLNKDDAERVVAERMKRDDGDLKDHAKKS